MSTEKIIDARIRPIGVDDLDGVLELNRAHESELSPLDRVALERLVGQAFCAWRIGSLDAFILALDERAHYTSPNFLWFKARYRRFAYVDRVAVARQARGRGLARALYHALFEEARKAGHDIVACEVNSDPPNPHSDAFHAALGFEVVGEATIAERGKSVRYMLCGIT